MAEIKSAIELAMERTQSLIMDDAEKKKLAAKALEGKIRAILRRYKERIIGIGGVEKELDTIGDDRETLQTTFIDLVVEELDLRGNDPNIIVLFNIAGNIVDKDSLEELKMLQRDYARDLEKKEVTIRVRIEKTLKARGISGDSISPNLETWNEWNEGLEETERLFQKRLIDWKQKLQGQRR